MTEYLDTIELQVEKDRAGERIDKFLSDTLSNYRGTEQEDESAVSFSRSYIQKLVGDGLVLVDNKNIKSNYKLSEGESITVNVPFPEELEILPEDIPLDIVYEDDDVILVNKPKGMVVHPAAGHYSGTLVNALMYHWRGALSGINGVLRPGIVHRIDMDTTGIIIACKNNAAHISLGEQLKNHSITRFYEAICYNNFSDMSGTVNAPIGRNPNDRKKMAINRQNGREAVTHYEVLSNLKGFAHIKCRLETGRTHQIRVHMASISHPILGDNLYCGAKPLFNLQGQTLHASTLGFVHPRTGEYMEFKAPLPDYFEGLLERLK